MGNPTYDYNEYTIRTSEFGIFVNDMEFASFDDAIEWIRAQEEGHTTLDFDLEQIMHNYCISFYDKNLDRVSNVTVEDYSIERAIDWVTTMYCPGSRVTSWYDINNS